MNISLKRRFLCVIVALVMIMTIFSDMEFANGAKTAKYQKISAQPESVSLIKDDGSLWSWGANSNPQSDDKSDQTSPRKIMDNVLSVSKGSHSAVIKTDGSLWTWGSNGCGELGDGTNKTSKTPKKVMDKVAKVSAGNEYTAVIKTDGSLWTWGANNYGQLGNGKIDVSPEAGIKPFKVMNGVADVCTGFDYTAAIKTDGSLWVWGQNWAGQLGDNTTKPCYTPKKVMDNVEAVSIYSSHTAVIKTDGSLWMWGGNRWGQLGDGTQTSSNKPKKVMEDVIAVSTNIGFTAAIKKDGSLWAWGDNDGGQLGNGNTIESSKPVKVMEDVVAVETSSRYILAQKIDGSLWMCGYNVVNPWCKVPTKVMENVAINNSVKKAIPYNENKNIKVLFNNNQVKFTQVPVIREGAILVAADEFFKAIGAAYKWNASTQSISVTSRDIKLGMQIGYNFISRNGIQRVLDTPPQLINGKVYIPVKSVAEELSASYEWDTEKQVAEINVLESTLLKKYSKYEEKMKIFGFDYLYNNQRPNSNEPVTKAEALKLAIAAVFNTDDISGFAAWHDEYENAIWVEYAKDSGITSENINMSNFEQKATYIDVITYLENCKKIFLKTYPVKTTDTKFKDIFEYSAEQQAAVADMLESGIITKLSDNLDGNKNIFKGQLNEMVVNFAERYNTIAPSGEKLVLDPKKQPSNANMYPYVLESVDKSYYEKPFFFYDSDKSLPKDLYAMKKGSYSQFEERSEDFLNNILNIDYRTITEEDFKERISRYLIFKPSDVNIRYYVKYVKDNQIIIEGSSKLLLPIIYFDGFDYRVRLRLNFEVKNSKTKDNLLYLDILNDYPVTYKNKKFDILVDYPVPITIGNNNIYMDESELYKGILDKDKCGITQKVGK